MLSTWMKLCGSLTTFVKTKCKNPLSRSMRTVHVHVSWNCFVLHQVPQKWKWQSLDILVVDMDMTDILLGLIRASREGEWMLHLASVRAMNPWCVAYDRLNYARFLPCYCAHCISFPHPTQICTLNSCKEGFQFSLAPTTPSEESLSITRSKIQ